MVNKGPSRNIVNEKVMLLSLTKKHTQSEKTFSDSLWFPKMKEGPPPTREQQQEKFEHKWQS